MFRPRNATSLRATSPEASSTNLVHIWTNWMSRLHLPTHNWSTNHSITSYKVTSPWPNSQLNSAIHISDCYISVGGGFTLKFKDSSVLLDGIRTFNLMKQRPVIPLLIEAVNRPLTPPSMPNGGIDTVDASTNTEKPSQEVTVDQTTGDEWVDLASDHLQCNVNCPACS